LKNWRKNVTRNELLDRLGEIRNSILAFQDEITKNGVLCSDTEEPSDVNHFVSKIDAKLDELFNDVLGVQTPADIAEWMNPPRPA
jgi:hypothetical protein